MWNKVYHLLFLRWKNLQSMPGIVAFVTGVSCSKLWMKFFILMCIKQSILSACMWECVPASTYHVPANGVGTKFLVNCQLKWFGKIQRREKKISCLISLFKKATINGTNNVDESYFPLISGFGLKPIVWTSGANHVHELGGRRRPQSQSGQKFHQDILEHIWHSKTSRSFWITFAFER